MSERRSDDRGRGEERGRGDISCKVYIGDLPQEATEKEIERTFGYYGSLKSVWIAQNPPGFAFAEFEDARDAEDAVRALDGTNLCGRRVRVEHSTGRVRPKPWNRGGGRGGGGGGGLRGGRRFDSDDRCYECGGQGHYSYDCPRSSRRGGGGGGGGGWSRGGGGGGGGGGGRRGGSYRSRSRSPRRRSRSRSQGRRSRSESPHRGGDGK